MKMTFRTFQRAAAKGFFCLPSPGLLGTVKGRPWRWVPKDYSNRAQVSPDERNCL